MLLFVLKLDNKLKYGMVAS